MVRESKRERERGKSSNFLSPSEDRDRDVVLNSSFSFKTERDREMRAIISSVPFSPNGNNSSSPLPSSSSSSSSASHQFEILEQNSDLFLLNLISVIDCLVIIMGTMGNLTSLYLLTRKRLRPVSSMRYLAALCLVDTVCLYGWYLSSVYRQLNGDHLRRIENLSPFLCKLVAYMSFSSLQLSSILLCMLTIDRFLIIVASKWRQK